MTEAGPYYETHVIVRPLGFIASARAVEHLGKARGFWSSTITHQAGGPPEERVGDLILTTRDATEDHACARIRELVAELKALGAEVRRYKVEHCTLDSKVADELALLGDEPVAAAA